MHTCQYRTCYVFTFRALLLCYRNSCLVAYPCGVRAAREQVVPGEKRPGAPGYFSVGPSLHQALSHRLLEVTSNLGCQALFHFGVFISGYLFRGIIHFWVFVSGYSSRGVHSGVFVSGCSFGDVISIVLSFGTNQASSC